VSAALFNTLGAIAVATILALGTAIDIQDRSAERAQADKELKAQRAERDVLASLMDDQAQCVRQYGENSTADQRPDGSHRCRTKRGHWLPVGAR